MGGLGEGRRELFCNFKFPFLDYLLIFSNQNIQPILTYSHLAPNAENMDVKKQKVISNPKTRLRYLNVQ